MDIQFQDLVEKTVKIEYKGKEIEFKSPNAQDAIKLITLLPKFEQLELIDQPEFYEVLNNSTGIPIEVLKKLPVGFKLKALSILFDLIDLDFFLDGLINMTETVRKFLSTDKIEEQIQSDTTSSQK